jgi:hypothetical protein
MKLSPIVLFVYNKFEKTELIIESLKKNKLSKKSELLIFSDSYKQDKKDKISVHKVRKIIKEIKGFKKIRLFFRKKNYGLYYNITCGLDYVFKKYSSAIILEDDILVSKDFLYFMNKSLNIYESKHDVGSICGTSYNLKDLKIPNTYFLSYQDCWGWATWRRSWKLYSHNSSYLLKKISMNKNSKKFNLEGYLDIQNYLKNNIKKKKSWASNWYASLYINNKLNLFPRFSICQNIGFDNDATNTKINFSIPKIRNFRIIIYKQKIQECNLAYKRLVSYHKIRKNYEKINYLIFRFKFKFNKLLNMFK